MAKRRLGELAVERALVSQEHLDLCVKIQEALRESPEHMGKRLGEILIEKGLLKPEDIEDLLRQQRELASDSPPPDAAPTPDAEEPPTPSEARPASRPETAPAHRRPARWRAAGIVVAAFVALIVAAVLLHRRAPTARSAVAAYLESCRPKGGPPDRALAVRSFRVTETLPPVTRDYSRELKSYADQAGEDTWPALLAAVRMPAAKRRALELAVPILPRGLTPKTAGSLVLTEQLVRCSAHFKEKGQRLFIKGALDVMAVRVETPDGTSPWRVASCKKAGPGSGK